MSWLTGFNKRIKVTASNTNIDSDLTHFPLLLTLGTSVGTGNTDVSCVFDELTSDANRKKIAVTKSDGETQCYVEIEKWDDANETAVLWVSKSDLTLSSSATTDLYLYYDSTHADNTTYVGDVGSRTEVWDSNHKAVYHMSESSYPYYDSTSNSKDSTDGTYPAQIDAKIGKGQDFERDSSNYIKVPTLANWSTTETELTLEAFVKLESVSNYETVFHSGDDGTFILRLNSDNTFVFGIHSNSTWYWNTTAGTYTSGVWYHLVASWKKNDYLKFYINASPESNVSSPDYYLTDLGTTYPMVFGEYSGGGTPADYFDGIMDEVRVSNTVRSAAWIKASYYTETDNLVSWGSEETSATNNALFFGANF